MGHDKKKQSTYYWSLRRRRGGERGEESLFKGIIAEIFKIRGEIWRSKLMKFISSPKVSTKKIFKIYYKKTL